MTFETFGNEPARQAPRRVRVQVALTAAVTSAGVIAVLVAGLGGSGGTPVSNARVRSVISAASSAISRTPSTTFTVTITISNSGHSAELHMTGMSSVRARESTLRTTGLGLDQTVLSVNHVVYVTVPSTATGLNDGKRWLAVRAQRPTPEQRQLQADGPAGYLKPLANPKGKILNEGIKTVDGVATTEYSLHVDAISLFGSTIRRIVPQATTSRLESFGLNDLPVQLWLDHNGLAREMALRMSYQGVTLSAVMYLHPSNRLPNLTAPVASSVHRVATLNQFLAVLRSMDPEPGVG